MSASADAKVKPPYVSYKTFSNFIDALNQDGIPGRIDSSVMKNLSGTAQAQLKSALRFLGLTDDDDRPQAQLRDLVNAEGEERQQVLLDILTHTYSFLFASGTGPIDLSGETPITFSAKFRDKGLGGDTVRKAESFFIQLATEAGILVPKRITSGRTSGERSRKGGARSARPQAKGPRLAASSASTVQPVPSPEATPQLGGWAEMMLQSMISKFPDFQPDWDEESRKNWFEQFRRITEMLEEYHMQEEKEDEAEF
jgi:hypothetical protein